MSFLFQKQQRTRKANNSGSSNAKRGKRSNSTSSPTNPNSNKLENESDQKSLISEDNRLKNRPTTENEASTSGGKAETGTSTMSSHNATAAAATAISAAAPPASAGASSAISTGLWQTTDASWAQYNRLYGNGMVRAFHAMGLFIESSFFAIGYNTHHQHGGTQHVAKPAATGIPGYHQQYAGLTSPTDPTTASSSPQNQISGGFLGINQNPAAALGYGHLRIPGAPPGAPTVAAASAAPAASVTSSSSAVSGNAQVPGYLQPQNHHYHNSLQGSKDVNQQQSLAQGRDSGS